MKFLEPDKLGIWYILTGLNIFSNILECGFQPVIVRHIAYSLSSKDIIGKNNINMLIESIIKIYKILSKMLFILLLIFGTYYMKNILLKDTNMKLIWGIYIITQSYQLSFSYFIPILNGYGKINSTNKSLALSKIITNFLMLFFLILKYNLLGLIIANFLGVLLLKILLFNELKKMNIKLSSETKNYDKSFFKKLSKEAFKMGIVSISQFLNVKYIFFLFGKFFSLEIVAQYGITIQIYELIAKLSRLPIDIYIPKLSQMIHKKEYRKAFKYYGRIMLVIILLYILGSTIITKYGNLILEFIGKNKMLDEKILILILIYYLIDIIYGVSTYFLTTFGFLDFYISFFITGSLCSLVSTIGMIYFKFNMLNIIFLQIIFQLLYNFWKWPLEVYRRYKLYGKNR